MKLFNFIKRQPKPDFSPEQTIRRLVDYMPDFYKTHRQFINCVEFLENREWELALDSLIELADETEPPIQAQEKLLIRDQVQASRLGPLQLKILARYKNIGYIS